MSPPRPPCGACARRTEEHPPPRPTRAPCGAGPRHVVLSSTPDDPTGPLGLRLPASAAPSRLDLRRAAATIYCTIDPADVDDALHATRSARALCYAARLEPCIVVVRGDLAARGAARAATTHVQQYIDPRAVRSSPRYGCSIEPHTRTRAAQARFAVS